MKTIRHTGIVVSNLKRSLNFYRTFLDLKVLKKKVESGDFIDTILGLKNVKVTTIKMSAMDGNLIEILYFHSHQHHIKIQDKRKICQTGISHISFTVEDLDYEYKRLRKAGIKFNSPPQFSPDGHAKVAFCRDPDDNFIELVQVL